MMLEAERLQVRLIISKFRNHPAVWGWDLSNEPSNLRIPRKRTSIRKWLTLLTNEIRSVDRLHPIILGTHAEDLEMNTNFYPGDISSFCNYLVVHGYPMSSSLKWAKNPLNPNVVPFLSVLTASMGGKPVIVEEFGAPTLPKAEMTIKNSKIYLATEDEQAYYYKEVLRNIYEVGSIGALAWCYADYDMSLWNKPPLNIAPHERTFGIMRSDGTPKLAAEVCRGFASRKLDVKTLGEKLKVTKRTYYSAPLENITRYYRRYLETILRF